MSPGRSSTRRWSTGTPASRAASRRGRCASSSSAGPTEVIRKAVKGMLPKNKLAAAQLTKLKVYAGPEHPHAAQAPKTS